MLLRPTAATLLAGLAILLFAFSIGAGQNPRAEFQYGQPNEDWLRQVQDSLNQAARNSPRGSALRSQIQRIIDDIGYYLEQASKAVRQADHELAEINAREAIRLLQRRVTKGYFRQEDVDPVVMRISQYLLGVLV